MGRLVREVLIDRLGEYLTEIHARPFHPVKHNCATFVLGAIAAETGAEPQEILAKLALTIPDTEEGVQRVLDERGGVVGLVSGLLGQPKSGAAGAKRGDVAYLHGTDGLTLGIIESGGVLAVSGSGLKRFPRSEVLGYWQV